MKKLFSKFLAIVLVLCLSISVCPTFSVFAAEVEPKEQLTKESTLWQPKADENKLNFEGDLSLDELKTAQLAPEETPEIVSEESIAENKHVNRLWEQEEDLNTIVFQNKDGTKTAYKFNEPVKYKDENGKIKDKSNKISKTSDGDYTNAENDINTYFPKKLNKNKGVELKFDEYTVEMAPDIKGNSGASRQTGHNKNFDPTEYVQYPNVFDERISLRYTPTFEGYKEDIVLNKYTGMNEFTFRLHTDGMSLAMNDDGSYYLIDPKTGEEKAQIGDIVVYDSKPLDTSSEVLDESVSNPTEEDYAKKEARIKEIKEKVSKKSQANPQKTYFHKYKVETVKADKEYLITIIVDEEYLTDSERVYPVYVDPTISVNAGKTINDAPIYSNKPYSALGGNTYNVVGYHSSTYGVGRTLMKFPGLYNDSTYSNLPSNRITSLQLHIYEGSGSTNEACIDLWQYGGTEWSEATARCGNIAWESYYNNFAWNFIKSSGWKTFDLTSVVPMWKSGSGALQGIMIMNGASEMYTEFTKHFLSTESGYQPYLTYTYNAITYNSVSAGTSNNGHIQQGGEYWYKFTPPQTDYYNIYTTGSVDTFCEFYQGTSSLLETDDNDGGGANFKITRKLSKGTTYYFKVRGYGLTTTGDYILKLETDFINQLQKLHNLAKNYADNNTRAVELTMQFIRRGKYTGNYMNLEFWGLAAGDIDTGFVNYVQSQDLELFEYFTITGDMYWYRANREKIDIPHLAATYNIYHFDTFGQIGSAMLPEYLINNLGGWAGDLRSIIPYVMQNVNYTFNYDFIYNETKRQIGIDDSQFSMPDLLADVDAYNLYNSVNVDSLETTFNNYYNNGGTNTRYTDFTNGWTKNEIFNFTKDMMTNIVVNSDAVWPLKKIDTNEELSLSDEQINAICNAFTDYLWEKIQME